MNCNIPKIAILLLKIILMGEIYTGTKFEYIQKGNKITEHPDLVSLIKWCRIFHEKQFAPPYPGGSSGNLSIRVKPGSDIFIITASHTALGDSMSDSDFSEVIYCSENDNIIYAKGEKEPSSESIMHYLIYKNRPEINAIFHGHSEEIMKLAKQSGFPETDTELEYGTVDLAKDTVNTLKNHNFVILKNHGFISVGETQNEAGNRILNL